MISKTMRPFKKRLILYFLLGLLTAVVAVVIVSCGGNTSTALGPGMGTVITTISDPPSCSAAASGAAAVPAGGTAAPGGTFISVFVTIRSIQAHTSATADDTSSGWQELAPQLVSTPVQVDLLNLPANGQCLLEQLGSTSLPAGDFQQIRLILLANAAPSGPTPSSNMCSSLGSDIFNCVVDSTGTHTLDLSSEANTGLKIPPGQIMGGPIHVAAGQSVDLNIDFNTCASIIKEGNGNFRLKPTLTAGVVSPNLTGISGQIVDSVTSQPIAGAIVTLQFADKSGTDRIVMQQLTDPTGHFGFCPLAAGAVFDVVADAITTSGAAGSTVTTAYDATVVFNVTGGTNLGAIPLVAETAATAGASTAPGTIQGTITAINGTTGAIIDADISALQSVTISSTSHTFTVPLFPNSNAADVMVTSSTSCPAGAPKGAFCGSYTLVVPASNPAVGAFSAGKTTITPPATGDVLYTVEADATNPASDAAMCSPSSSQTTSKDATAMPLKVTAGATTTAAELDFTGCS